MRLFLFAVGGSGARVLRSLTMLLSSGATVPNDVTIIPILLDMDMTNADITLTTEAIELYRKIQVSIYDTNEKAANKTFFRTPIQYLGEQQVDGRPNPQMSNSLLTGVANGQQTFSDFIQYDSLDEEDKELMNLLYYKYDDPNNPEDPDNEKKKELKLSLNVGFKGNPNIGTVVFNNFIESPAYTYFVNIFNQNTDKIFIISSIFGGMGSSGFPQLTKILSTNTNANIQEARKGAITIKPYFGLQSGLIDASSFNSKAKAALSYYNKLVANQIHDFYYIGDNTTSAYPNQPGGALQKNPSHLVEMIAATSVLHFLSLPNPDKGKVFNKKTYEFGVKCDIETEELNFSHFNQWSIVNVIEPMLQFAYAAKIYGSFLPLALINKNAGFTQVQALNLVKEFNADPVYTNLKTFFKTNFLDEWLCEMALNTRAFNPFGFSRNINPFESNDNYNSLIKNKKIETNSGFMGFRAYSGIDNTFLLANFTSVENGLRLTTPNQKQRFIQVLIQVANKCRKELGTLPTT